MNKWTIDKSFEFDYSHRVWQQVLNYELAQTNCLKCRGSHGHRGTIKVHLSANELDNKGMVLDFNELNFFKKFIDTIIDHKCILDINDPANYHFYPLFSNINLQDKKSINEYLEYSEENYYTFYLRHLKDFPDYAKEIYGSLVFVPFIPTSENLSKWFYDILTEKLQGFAKVEKIEFFETPKSRSIYSNN